MLDVDFGLIDASLVGLAQRTDGVSSHVLFIVNDAVLLAQIGGLQTGILDLQTVGEQDGVLAGEGGIFVALCDFLAISILVIAILVIADQGLDLIDVSNLGSVSDRLELLKTVILGAHVGDTGVITGGQQTGECGNHVPIGQSIEQHILQHDGDPLAGSGAGGVGLVAFQQTNGGGIVQNVFGPLGANIAAGLGVVTDGGQQHFGGFGGGDAGIGIKLAVATAGDQLGGGTVIDITLGPVAGGHIVEELAALVGGSAVILAVVQDDVDDLGHLGTGNGLFGHKLVLFVTPHDPQGVHQFDSALAVFVDLAGIHIGISGIVGKSGDRQNHCQSQGECDQFLDLAHNGLPPNL